MFFEQYKSLCLSVGKKPNTVAKELGIASSSITQWKHGSTPRAQILQKIADYFDVSVSYLIGEYDQKEKPASKYGDGKIENMQLLIEKMKQSGIDLENATPEDLQRWVNIIVAAEK